MEYILNNYENHYLKSREDYRCIKTKYYLLQEAQVLLVMQF